MPKSWSPLELGAAVESWDRVLQRRGLTEKSRRTAVGDARRFVAWLVARGSSGSVPKKSPSLDSSTPAAVVQRKPSRTASSTSHALDVLRAAITEWEADGRPAQGAVSWGQGHWLSSEELANQREFLRGLPPALDRDDVRRKGAFATRTPLDALRAALVVMAWGYRGRGRGRHFAELLAKAPNAGARLRDIAAALAADGAAAGYRILAEHRSELPGLGGSYGTKFLFFCQPVDHGGHTALILDKYVADWIRAHDGSDLRQDRFDPEQYERYLSLVHGWARQLNRDAADLELAIFRDQTRTAQNAWGKL